MCPTFTPFSHCGFCVTCLRDSGPPSQRNHTKKFIPNRNPNPFCDDGPALSMEGRYRLRNHVHIVSISIKCNWIPWLKCCLGKWWAARVCVTSVTSLIALHESTMSRVTVECRFSTMFQPTLTRCIWWCYSISFCRTRPTLVLFHICLAAAHSEWPIHCVSLSTEVLWLSYVMHEMHNWYWINCNVITYQFTLYGKKMLSPNQNPLPGSSVLSVLLEQAATWSLCWCEAF